MEKLKNNKFLKKIFANFTVILSTISPKLSTKLLYILVFKKRLNLKKPKDFNEKIQYLKLYKYTNNEIITKCIDKYLVKDYLKFDKNDICKTAKLFGVYDDVNDIAWEKLPQKFVIKCNNGCGSNIVCDDKEKLDIVKTKKQLKSWMHMNYWKMFAESQYKNIDKRILIEEFLGNDLKTYKFYCFNGIPKVIYVSSNGENGEKDLYLDYFDTKWNLLPITLDGHKHCTQGIEKPKQLKKMLNIATELSKEFPFVRIDLYDVNNEIYFSEYTFVPTGGFMKITPASFLDTWGDWLDI
jgi:hypothetical protein